MFTTYTYQDWLEEYDKPTFIMQVIAAYKNSYDFQHGLEALDYYRGCNREVMGKTILKADVVTYTDERGLSKRELSNQEVAGNRLANGFFGHAVKQQVQFLLGNGVILESGLKERLGFGFDKALSEIGRFSLIEGVCWGYWNLDHIEVIKAAENACSGFVALLDEQSGLPRVGVQFWQLDSDKPMQVRLFEEDGLTMLARRDNKGGLEVTEEKRPYVLRKRIDSAGEMIVGGGNYSGLPVIPFLGNEERESELTPPIKSKIDCYDRIVSDLGDNLDRANDVYWVLNNFGGGQNDVLALLDAINRVKAVIAQSDMGGSASAEPRTIEVPYEARKTALELLEKSLYRDYMALDIAAMTGGSLTNVAIKAAMSDLSLKADLFEWQAFQFVQNVLRLIGAETEEISFRRQSYANNQETVQDICLMRNDIDQRTALRLNPYINQDEIEDILAAVEEEKKNQSTVNREALENALFGGESNEGEKTEEAETEG